MPIGLSSIGQQVPIRPIALSQASFSDFGMVIENVAPTLTPAPFLPKSSLPRNAVQANQGTALKFLDVTRMVNLYGSAPSQKPSKAVMNMFVCAPRSVQSPPRTSSAEGMFPVKILERHPYTTQTFIPLGVSASEAEQARYLVIVAPSLEPSPVDAALPAPPYHPGRGLPDLKKIKAYIATGSQAITYGAGTWHAPMVVIGQRPIDFVVVQFANDVAIEDCQEAELAQEDEILVEIHAIKSTRGLSKL